MVREVRLGAVSFLCGRHVQTHGAVTRVGTGCQSCPSKRLLVAHVMVMRAFETLENT